MTKLKDILSPAFPPPRPRKPLVTVEYDSDFCLWVTDGSHQSDGKPILTEAQMHHAAEQYRLGKSKSGKTIFWMIDECGIVRDGLLGDAWVSALLKAREPELLRYWRVQHCLFGLHLIGPAKNTESTERVTLKAVAIVESQRSAVILSEIFPENIWLATMSTCCFSIDLLIPLKGRKVKVFPSTDETMANYCCWNDICDLARRNYRLDIECSAYLEDQATPAQKQRHIDLVDFIFDHESNKSNE